jgi:hypothetical protein
MERALVAEGVESAYRRAPEAGSATAGALRLRRPGRPLGSPRQPPSSEGLSVLLPGALIAAFYFGAAPVARISTRPAISTFWWMLSHLARNTIQANPI